MSRPVRVLLTFSVREPRLRDPRPAGLGNREGDAEIAHHRVAVLEEDVLRLEVTVNHALLVGVFEGARHAKVIRITSSSGN